MTNKMKKAKAFKEVLALIVSTLLLVFAGCKQDGGVTGSRDKPTAKKYKVELMQSDGGTVTVSPSLPNDVMVTENTELIFTATAVNGYKVDKWEITGVTATEGGTGDSTTAKIIVTKDVKVKVTFRKKGKYRVTITKLGEQKYGRFEANITNLNNVEEDTLILFTATPDSKYRSVKTWKVNDADIENKDADGKVKTKYQQKITGNLDVKMQFEEWAKVPYSDLSTYMSSSATYKDIPNYIEITGEIPFDDFKGSAYNQCGALGNKIKSHLDKEVAFRINYPSGLKSIFSCFSMCKNLISLEALPSTGLEDIASCFFG
ncbi:MAG: InlB B-repeat-containing protein [Treponema sp.]